MGKPNAKLGFTKTLKKNKTMYDWFPGKEQKLKKGNKKNKENHKNNFQTKKL